MKTQVQRLSILPYQGNWYSLAVCLTQRMCILVILPAMLFLCLVGTPASGLNAGIFSGFGNYLPVGIVQNDNVPDFFANILLPADSTTGATTVMGNLDDQIALMISSSDPAIVAAGQQLQILAYEANPTLVCRSGTASFMGTGVPVCIDTDVSSISLLYENNPQYTDVEMITLRVFQPADLSTIVDLSAFQSFSNLKYLYVLCLYQVCAEPGCAPALLLPMFQGSSEPTPVFLYKISIAN